MFEGIETVAPILQLVEAEVGAAEVRAEMATRGAQDHEARATRVETELSAMQEREEQRLARIGGALTAALEEYHFEPDNLARLLGVVGPTAEQASFDALMRDPSGVLTLGPNQEATVTERRDLSSVARLAEKPPLGQPDTAAFLAASLRANRLANAPGCGLCVRVASGDIVLLGNGTCIAVHEARYTQESTDDAFGQSAGARELSVLRLASGGPPVLAPSARAALAACLHARRASVVCDARSLGPYMLFGAAIDGSTSPTHEITRLAELGRTRGNRAAVAAALLAVAYTVFRVHIREGESLKASGLSDNQELIDVGRLRWCRLSGVPVFWIPLWASDPDRVGGADQPWTLDIPAAGASWHPQSPVMSLDPGWHARIVVVPGDPNLWAVDPEGTWWSLDSDFEAVLESRRAHIQIWLEALEAMEREVPARIDRLAAAGNATSEGQPGSPSREKSRSDQNSAMQAVAPSSEPARFSRDWVLERAKRYAYQDDSAARAAGARAARGGQYSREDFLTIVRWKSARALSRAERNAPAAVEQMTRAAFNADDEVTRVLHLVSLEGVGVPVASALLHFAFPETYPILDFRALHSLGDMRRRTQYSPAFWSNYVKRCQDLADRAGVTIRDLDKALWQDSRESGPGGRA